MDIFYEIHDGLPREGPGDHASTINAFSMLKRLPDEYKILDIGCGPGMQTVDLAKQTGAQVIALDTHIPFLKVLARKAQSTSFSQPITLISGSMHDLPFRRQSFEVIWSEGAIYITGFENGLRNWKNFLKPGGYLAVTEISWLRPDVPEPVFSYWKSEYPGIKSIPENLEIIKASGFAEIGHFILSPSSWWADYYTPIETRHTALQAKYRGNSEALAMLEASKLEIEMYRNYSEWYGYVFYVMRNIE